MGHPLFHFEVSVRNCGVRVRLNDFPIAELTAGDTPVWFAPPVNPYLVGELNVVDVQLLAVERGEELTTFWDASFSAGVRRYEKGQIVSPGVGPLVTELSIPDELKERVRDEELSLPQSFMHVFENDTVDFSPELTGAPAFDEPDALRDYAVHVRDLFSVADVPALMVELEPRARAWSAAYDHPYDEIAASLESSITELVTEGIRTDWDRSDVELVPCCGGRVWELTRPGGRPLVETEPDEEGATMFMPAFASLCDGQLRLIR